MRGIVLAGGKGTRLAPLTVSVNKHLLPVYDKPLIYWPVMTLVRIGIQDITIVGNPDDIEKFRALFGDGARYGVSISYAVQAQSNGVAGALFAAGDSLAGDSVAVILGDNIFFDTTAIRQARKEFEAAGEKGSMLFLKEVPDPERFGVALVRDGRVVSLVEKPATPASNLAATGLYFYDANIGHVVQTITPSARGELEITDVNTAYLAQGTMQYRVLETDWIDAGTHESLLQANIMAAGMAYEPDKKIKILFGINKLAVGGAEHLVLHQLKHIQSARFDARLVTLRASTTPNLDAEALWLGSRWERFTFSGFMDVWSWWRLYRYLRRERFDVVVANLFFTSIILRVTAVLARVPVIFSSELNAYTKRNAAWRPFERFLARFTNRFIAVSREVQEASIKELGVAREKVVLNYSAIDVAEGAAPVSDDERKALRMRYGIPEDALVITAAGRLVEQKGHIYVLDAFSTLASRTQPRPLHLIIFGDGPLRSSLEARVKELGLSRVVHMPGVAPVRDILSVTDIFTMPSLWEGLSLMLLNAMAAGKPIVATAVSGSSEVITNGENGYVVPPKDVPALTEKLEALVSSNELRLAFGQASVKEVQKFSIEHNLQNLYTLIRSARAQRSTPTHA